MTHLERYNQARNREQAAFELSDVGRASIAKCNAGMRGHIVGLEVQYAASLAAEYAFGARMPAFYAGRAVHLW